MYNWDKLVGEQTSPTLGKHTGESQSSCGIEQWGCQELSVWFREGVGATG